MKKLSKEMIINEKEQKKQKNILSGKRIKIICERYNLKQSEIAAIIDTYPQTLNNAIKGNRPLPKEKAEKLCEYIKNKFDNNISVGWLLGSDCSWNSIEKEYNTFRASFTLEQLSDIMGGYDINYDKDNELFKIKDSFGYEIFATKSQIDFFLHNVYSMQRILSRQFFASISDSACALYSNQEDKANMLLFQNGFIRNGEL